MQNQCYTAEQGLTIFGRQSIETWCAMINGDGTSSDLEYICSQEAFDKWLYENYSIWNGDRLLQLYEDGGVLQKYIDDMGLPQDIDLEF